MNVAVRFSFYLPSGKLDEGTGSPPPGAVTATGSDASIDSSLPTSTLASSQSGFFLSLSSSSRSGAPDRVGALAPSFPPYR